MQELDLLILGAGWTSTFLLPLAQKRNISLAATTRDGRSVAGTATLKWSFDPEGTEEQFAQLPLAKNVLITFPLKGEGQSELLVRGYEKAWEAKVTGGGTHFIQLGSTGIWQTSSASTSQQTSLASCWLTRHSPYTTSNPRAIAEDELISLGGSALNLAGLWGGERDPRNWISRVATTKEQVKEKKSLHLVHGVDVARAILALIGNWEHAKGQRWMLTDGFVYDWWSLFAAWASVGSSAGDVDPSPTEQAKWVYELMEEGKVRGLPRSMETLGRCYDTREFWETFRLAPVKAGV